MIVTTLCHNQIIEKLGEGGPGIVYIADAACLERYSTPKSLAATVDQ